MPSRVAAGTSTGLIRKRNEDGAYVGRWLCAVADGMGGHAAGDLASATVIEAIRPFDIAVTPDRLTATLGRAVRKASDLVAARAEADPEVASMGSTLTALLWSGSHVALANVGDSRAYLLRDGRLAPITEDHVLSKLVASPMPSQIGSNLVRFLDKRPGVSADLVLRTVRPGDRYLLCSDGLNAVLSAAAIRDALAGTDDLEEAARSLIRLTHEAGAPDNVTVIVVDLPEGTWQERAENPVILGSAAVVAAG